ncbi:MAG: hypothetical protein JOY98_11505 [Candidatus Eremiobacteraeota bacterium]|nr:hypothetical protein [Candidatus Eremiobacteraeota bacterium]
MGPQISGNAFDQFFGYAPLVIGIVIYAIFYVAKRREVTETGVPIGQTYACAGCGRRGARDHMVPQEHAGAVSWFCPACASKP